MEQLPLEILQQILIHLDLKTLRNTALSCRAFFNAFKTGEGVITGEILLRQIDYDVLPEAILVNKSWSLGTPSVSKGIAFANNLRHRKPAPTMWTLAVALSLAHFHEKVNYLALEAAHEALKKQPRLLRESPMPTYNEICRFERALYRFQLYCNIVGLLFPVDGKDLLDMFFEYFAMWENEQLSCIHEHLVRVVSKPFNYLVEHDITWGYLRVPCINGHLSVYAQGILTGGLEKIYYLSKALNYRQCHSLLSRGEGLNGRPFEAVGFLSYGLQRGANPFVAPPVRLSEMSEYDKAIVCTKPFYNDPDPGPASMWEWVYRNSVPGYLVANPGMLAQRRWAFPFWDFSRLRAAGLLGDPGIPGLQCSSDPELELFSTSERLELLEESRRERTKIRIRGGTGFYSSDGLIEIEWDDSNKIESGDQLLVQPRSIEEARRFLKEYGKDTV
ncbi:hypothetical protein F5Y10DRAFT_29727 [Nemania abortiva]|nr:hypothetical protein F5Y10DRAFT_29727 [Nemania abortiva]